MPPAEMTFWRVAKDQSMNLYRLNTDTDQFLISLQELRDGTSLLGGFTWLRAGTPVTV
jgi:hypothetical protein